MIRIKYSTREYMCSRVPSGIYVRAEKSETIAPDEQSARLWLGNHGLRRSRIANLLNAALRKQGPYADPDHPHRKFPKTTFTPPTRYKYHELHG